MYHFPIYLVSLFHHWQATINFKLPSQDTNLEVGKRWAQSAFANFHRANPAESSWWTGKSFILFSISLWFSGLIPNSEFTSLPCCWLLLCCFYLSYGLCYWLTSLSYLLFLAGNFCLGWLLLSHNSYHVMSSVHWCLYPSLLPILPHIHLRWLIVKLAERNFCCSGKLLPSIKCQSRCPY